MLARIVGGTLAACGNKVLYADVSSTPTLGVLVRMHGAAGGVQISASHNPPAYNGLKLFDAGGRVLPAATGQLVLAAYRDSRQRWVAADRIGREQPLGDTTGRHLELIREMIYTTIDINAIRARHFRVLLDSNNGAGSLLGRRLLSELACQVVYLGCDPTGQFEHPPEPTAANLVGVCERVRFNNVD